MTRLNKNECNQSGGGANDEEGEEQEEEGREGREREGGRKRLKSMRPSNRGGLQ